MGLQAVAIAAAVALFVSSCSMVFVHGSALKTSNLDVSPLLSALSRGDIHGAQREADAMVERHHSLDTLLTVGRVFLQHGHELAAHPYAKQARNLAPDSVRSY